VFERQVNINQSIEEFFNTKS